MVTLQNKLGLGTWLSALVISLSACSDSIDESPSNKVSPTAEAPTRGSGESEDDIRQCDSVITISGNRAQKLYSFFGESSPVSNIEGDVTYCLSLDPSGSGKITGSLRVEYEDDLQAAGYMVSGQDNTLTGTLKANANDGYDLDIIFKDDFGLIQIMGSSVDGGEVESTIRFYNFPPFEEWLADQEAKAKAACEEAIAISKLPGRPKQGDPTVADKCYNMGGAPTPWWKLPQTLTYEQQIIKDARAALNDLSKTQTLGSISVDLSKSYQN